MLFDQCNPCENQASVILSKYVCRYVVDVAVHILFNKIRSFIRSDV